MQIEILMATMFLKGFDFLKKANIYKSYLIINQTDFNSFPNIQSLEGFERIISVEERGLSNSRNLAISNSKGDVCIIADDDVQYVDHFQDIIKKAYLQYTDADVILFDMVRDENNNRKKIKNRDGQLNRIEILRGNSVRITFKRNSVISNGIKFNNRFGAGSGHFIASEELVFLTDCYDNGLKIYYVDTPIVGLQPSESTWFNGYDESYFNTIGAFSYHYAGSLWFLYVAQFIIRHLGIAKSFGVIKSLKSCFQGVEKYKCLLK